MNNTVAPLLDQVFLQPFTELAANIPDGTIHAVVCDPVFENEDMYRQIAAMSARILIPGGSCVLETPHAHLLKYGRTIEEFLTYFWIIGEREVRSARIWGKRIMVGWMPYLWFIKPIPGSKLRYDGGAWGRDFIGNTLPDKQFHIWGDSLITMITLIKAVTNEGDIVFDPCTGGGTVPTACKLLNRRYIACDIDAVAIDTARERLHGARQMVSSFVTSRYPTEQPDLFNILKEEGE